ncbi:hypothetical protein PITC_043490 [Penicillium italicum]|uniref:Uncharacterized protein n=1 Tax=Penicillium italicum TaxID=40296 RepID=A0A0A2L6P3_PENIT|nr:hypothetical protein PITC_043490 [Penicillium italicum]
MSWTHKHINTVGTTKTTSASIISGFDSWNACGVELRWKSTDLTSAPVLAFASPTTAVVAPTTTATSTPESEEKSWTFSTVAKAGAVVGVALSVILAVRRVGFWILRRKRREKNGGKEPSELAGTQNLTPQHAIHELDFNLVFEKDGVRGVRSQLKEPVDLEGPGARSVDLDASHDLIV